MTNTLTPEEKQYLVDHFRFLDSTQESDAVTLDLLMDECYLTAYLNEIKVHMRTEKLKAAASQFTKRLGYIMTVPLLYSMTVFNKKLDSSLRNCTIVTQNSNGKWMPYLAMKDLTVIKPAKNERDIWRQALLIETFRNISKVLDRVSAVAFIPKAILWENVAIYVYWLYEKRMRDEMSIGSTGHISSDFDYMIHQAPGNIFGEAENPLLRFYGTKHESHCATESIRTRKTCCLYYELNPLGECCTICPKVTFFN